MALLEGLEIYIPEEAEVRSIPLRFLPNSVLRKMSPSLEPPQSSDCVWISPALFQRKGQKESAQDQASARQHMLTVLGNTLDKHASSALGSTHWKMSFVTANLTAYRVLKETLPVGPHTPSCGSAKVPKGSPSNNEQDAVIIYHGRIYLSVKRKRPERSKSQRPGPDRSSAHSQRAPVTQTGLKRKLDSTHNAPEVPQPKFSDCGPQGACHSQGASSEVSPNQGDILRTSRSQGSRQRARRSQAASPEVIPSQEADLRADQNDQSQGYSHGASLGAILGSSADPGPQEEFDHQSPSLAPYLLHSAPHSPSPSWSISKSPALPDWGPSETLESSLGVQQQEFDFKVLARRERIAQMEAKLLKSDETLNSL